MAAAQAGAFFADTVGAPFGGGLDVRGGGGEGRAVAEGGGGAVRDGTEKVAKT